jgi:hypothetical protein
MPGEHPGLLGIRAPTQLEAPFDDVRVVEHPSEVRRRFERIRASSRDATRAVDRGALNGQEVVEGDRPRCEGNAVFAMEQSTAVVRIV